MRPSTNARVKILGMLTVGVILGIAYCALELKKLGVTNNFPSHQVPTESQKSHASHNEDENNRATTKRNGAVGNQSISNPDLNPAIDSSPPHPHFRTSNKDEHKLVFQIRSEAKLHPLISDQERREGCNKRAMSVTPESVVTALE
jgi:hypothetical protein